MEVQIQGFGLLGPVLGTVRVVDIADNGTVGDALDALGKQVDDFKFYRKKTAVAIGDVLVKADHLLSASQTLVLIPPVGGG